VPAKPSMRHNVTNYVTGIDKTIGISRSHVLSLTEGGHWTLFGRANGLTVRGKDSSIFIPADCDQYAEIKAKLGGWQPTAG